METLTAIAEIRNVKPADLPGLVKIENTTNPESSQWCERDFRAAFTKANYEGLVAVRHTDKGVQIVGFIVYGFDFDKIKVVNFAVHPKYMRKGIGTALLDHLKTKLQLRRNILEIDIRETNLATQLYLKKRNFRAHLVRNWYDQPKEDAYRFQYIRSADGHS